MRWKTRVLIPIFAAIVYLIAAFFLEIVPCQVAPNVPNPVYSWGFCSLNPDNISPFGIQSVYWGASSSLSQTYILSLGVIFLLAFLIILIFPKSRHIKKEEK